MTLTLSILRGPEGVATDTRRITGGTLAIGRGPANEWVLPDPERVLSKRHCVIALVGESWQVTDTSVNGTFLNHEAEPLGSDLPRILRNGDRLLLGSYEIDTAIGDAAAAAAGAAHFTDERLTGDPFPAIRDDPFGISMPPLDLPADFARTSSDQAPAVAANFRAPRPSFGLLPEDWDIDEPAAAPLLPAAAPAIDASSPPVADAAPVQPAQAGPAFAAFAAGAGIDGSTAVDPLALLRSLGGAFRAVVAGLRRAMIARATIKGGFRIDQTMIQASGNNPLKFAADDDDALAALLGIGRQGGMSAERAVHEAMRDIRLHELAMAAAMQQAVRDMLAQLAPAQVARRVPGHVRDKLPGGRGSRLWSAYESLHRETAQAMTDDFDRVFGRSFMRAYERAMREIAAAETD